MLLSSFQIENILDPNQTDRFESKLKKSTVDKLYLDSISVFTGIC